MDDKDMVRRLADELEIRNLIARLAHLADGGDLNEYVSLFTEDASWEMPGGPRRGRADILAGATERRTTGTTGPGSATRHVLTTIGVTIDDADTATTDSYWMFYGDTTTAPAVRLMGLYHDTFRRTDEGWKLARREITFG
ncbi:MAG TPA: nuclear transport factor 2 family protein [Acidimicrobiales bacterium]|nr:nuclear transport factor 2 family protein [Acidimicrobiales bacterium]